MLKRIIFIIVICMNILFSSDTDLKFANHLYDSADYYRAITYYKKHIFTKKTDLAFAYYRIGRSFYNVNRYFDALEYYYHSEEYGDTKYNKLSKVFTIMSYYNLFNTKTLHNKIGLFKQKYPKGEYTDRILYIEGFDYLRHGLFEDSIKTLKTIQTEFPDSSLSKNNELLLKYVSGHKNIVVKKPWLSASLSLIPGLGQFYSGYTIDGIQAFVTNSIFAGLSIYTYNRETNNHTKSYILGSVGLLFYIANIHGAYQSAKRTNSINKEMYIIKAFNNWGYITIDDEKIGIEYKMKVN